MTRAHALGRAAGALARTPGLTAVTALALGSGLFVWLAASSVVSTSQGQPPRAAERLHRIEVQRLGELEALLQGTDMAFVAAYPRRVLSGAEVEAFSAACGELRHAAITAAPVAVSAGDAAPSLELAFFAGPATFSLFDLPLSADRPYGAGARGEVVLSAAAATRWFGGAAAALGRPLRVGGEAWTVAGVLEPRATLGRRLHAADTAEAAAVWLAFPAADRLQALPVVWHPAAAAAGGRLHASLWVELPTPAAGEALLSRLRREAPGLGLPPGEVALRRYQDFQGAFSGASSFRALEVFGLVLLLAGGFTAMRLSTTRLRLQAAGLAVRRAVGASRREVVGEVLLQSGLLGLLGAAVGVALAAALLQGLAALYPTEAAALFLPPGRALLGLGVGVALAVASALLPAWRLSGEPIALGLRRA